MQKNKEQGEVGPYSHGHGQTFGSNDGGTLTMGVINSSSLRHSGGGSGVYKNINLKWSPLSHSKSLSRGKTFEVGPIDKEVLGK